MFFWGLRGYSREAGKQVKQASNGSLATVPATVVISRQTTNCRGIHLELKKISLQETPQDSSQISLARNAGAP